MHCGKRDPATNLLYKLRKLTATVRTGFLEGDVSSPVDVVLINFVIVEIKHREGKENSSEGTSARNRREGDSTSNCLSSKA